LRQTNGLVTFEGVGAAVAAGLGEAVPPSELPPLPDPPPVSPPLDSRSKVPVTEMSLLT
jgi:hypothetical protein